MTPRTLFGRVVLVIALVSAAFAVFTIAVITYFALVPLGRLATQDLSALMLTTAQSWQAANGAERAQLQDRLARQYRLQVQDPPQPLSDTPSRLPYFHLLESSLAERTGRPIALRYGHAAGGQPWYWADLPAGGTTVRVGFAADRVSVQPSVALMIVLGVGALVTLITAAVMARWLITPLARLVSAMQPVGQGRAAAPLPETGPQELAVLAREFNRMGARVEELLTNRTSLLAGISHDLRSPLARIRLALGMYADKPDADLLDRTMRDVDGMNELIGRCLEVGRDFSERESVELDLCALLAEIAGEYEHTGVKIRGHRGPDCRLRVRPLALRRILSNLIDNAVRYGEQQPVDIGFNVIGRDVEICVLDRGPGIPDDALEAIFLPFHRLDASRSTRTGGSGLGLAIVRQIAAANGWTVALRPRAGGGMAACVRLPLENSLQGATGKPAAP